MPLLLRLPLPVLCPLLLPLLPPLLLLLLLEPGRRRARRPCRQGWCRRCGAGLPLLQLLLQLGNNSHHLFMPLTQPLQLRLLRAAGAAGRHATCAGQLSGWAWGRDMPSTAGKRQRHGHKRTLQT